MSQWDEDVSKLERELRFFPVVNEHPRRLTEEQIRFYNENGYLTGLKALDEAQAVEARERWLAEHPADEGARDVAARCALLPTCSVSSATRYSAASARVRASTISRSISRARASAAATTSAESEVRCCASTPSNRACNTDSSSRARSRSLRVASSVLPSSRWQICAITLLFWIVAWKPGKAAWARSTNRRTAA